MSVFDVRFFFQSEEGVSQTKKNNKIKQKTFPMPFQG